MGNLYILPWSAEDVTNARPWKGPWRECTHSPKLENEKTGRTIEQEEQESEDLGSNVRWTVVNCLTLGKSL